MCGEETALLVDRSLTGFKGGLVGSRLSTFYLEVFLSSGGGATLKLAAPPRLWERPDLEGSAFRRGNISMSTAHAALEERRLPCEPRPVVESTQLPRFYLDFYAAGLRGASRQTNPVVARARPAI